MERLPLPLFVLGCMLVAPPNHAQTLFNNASNLVAGSDNTGDVNQQPGTEVLNSTPGSGVKLATGGSYEHVGQFYVAANGIWNYPNASDGTPVGNDYFGYAPIGVGSNMAYLGKGIMGASTRNGGKGIGRPNFGHLQLNSTGEFPLEGGMFVTHSLTFNANGPGKSSLVTTPNCTNPDSPLNAVVFAPTAIVQGANDQNYINGFASVTGVSQSFTLPLGDPAAFPHSLRPLTVNNPTPGTITARYLHAIQHPTDALGEGIGSVSSVGNWPVSAPAGTSVTVSLPPLNTRLTEAATLRLVGWTGSEWVDLSGTPTPGACLNGNCDLTGTLRAGITTIAIGSTRRSMFSEAEEGSLTLTVWPNPTQGLLQATLSAGQAISQLHVLDQQGKAVLLPVKSVNSVDVSTLPSGNYILEVLTTQGQAMRQHFIKQP